MTDTPEDPHNQHYLRRTTALYRQQDPEFADWAGGYGLIRHTSETQMRVFTMACDLHQQGLVADRESVYRILKAADRLAHAAMWLVVQMTYVQNVYTDGRLLQPADFKPDPQGHTGGALNMVPAYIGYLTANALTGLTRSWLMGQGHCVAAIDASNLLLGNLGQVHEARYDWSDAGLSRFVQDFYAYGISGPEGRPVSPLGSHVNVHTAGGMHEGGYLGFAELQYVHMPLPGERLVAFLSDGAFEEQRGSDWAPRWWRGEDSGLVTPVMIANGRRIEQRSTLFQQGGAPWLARHLALNDFAPVVIDGTDPAAFAWAIRDSEEHLLSCAEAIRQGDAHYPVPLRYVIAVAPKGFGFAGAGSNRAHNLPLAGNPAREAAAQQEFNHWAQQLFVPPEELQQSVREINNHAIWGREQEKDHALAHRQVQLQQPLSPSWQTVEESAPLSSPMEALDHYFVALSQANPQLRVRVGNPDELRSNSFGQTLDRYRHRVYKPEEGVAEAVDGCVITALNEEAVACAAFGNKGGINVVVSYEAFAIKMLGAMRQEIIFARHQREAGSMPGWLSVPFLLTSHTWENGKNEQSHQDPTLGEVLLGEMADSSVVRFPADANSALAALADCYQRQGEIHSLIVPKKAVPRVVDGAQAQQLVRDGALLLAGEAAAPVRLVAVGAYQLQQCQRAWQRLQERGCPASLVYMQEPGRFRGHPRDRLEAAMQAPAQVRQTLFPAPAVTLLVSHTRAEPLLGLLQGLINVADGQQPLLGLGYRNRGGTLDTPGMLFANGCSWLHILAQLAGLLQRPPEDWLTPPERAALAGENDPRELL